jgi:hypothetical protein
MSTHVAVIDYGMGNIWSVTSRRGHPCRRGCGCRGEHFPLYRIATIKAKKHLAVTRIAVRREGTTA